MAEMLEIIDGNGVVVGLAPRARCHGDPSLLHRSVHVAVFHPDGRLLLQKRSRFKDVQPGKWDTAVGGHLDPGEDFEAAARREMREELGLPDDLPLERLFDSEIRNDLESENVRLFRTTFPGPFRIQESELDEVRFFSRPELVEGLSREDFTPALRAELARLLALPELWRS